MSRIIVTLVCISILMGCSACVSSTATSETDAKTPVLAKAESKLVGIAVQSEDKSLLPDMVSMLIAQGEDYSGLRFEVAKETQPGLQVRELASLGVELIVVETTEDSEAVDVCDEVAGKNLPIVFIGNEPPQPVLQSCKNAYYIGGDKATAGQKQGELAVRLWDCFSDFDKNKDGKMQLVVLGDDGGIATGAVNEIEGIGVGLELCDRLDTTQSTAIIIGKRLRELETPPELILCDSGDVAVDAVVALQNMGYNSSGKGYIGVIGVGDDATSLKVTASGAMTACVAQDTEAVAEAVLSLGSNLFWGGDVPKSGESIEVSYGFVTAPEYRGK